MSSCVNRCRCSFVLTPLSLLFFSKMPEARRLGGPRGRVNNERGDNSYKTARLGQTAVFVMLMFKQHSKYGQ